ncbi:MAG: hypothetical protein U0414_35425 [Polyangiaceae bacterium]
MNRRASRYWTVRAVARIVVRMKGPRRGRARLDVRVHALTLALLTACSDYHDCPVPDPTLQANLPARLSETGLFAAGTTELAPGVRPYTPTFALWSDGAEKRRWISIPEGARIDTKDMDAWRFPVGTKVWKEFVRDGVRVETRLLQKIDESDAGWAAMAYAWTADGSDAVAAPLGVIAALGTPHDIPAADRCMGCHAGRASRVLGFSALQLSHEGAEGEWDLDRLRAASMLTTDPGRSFEIPGDADTRAALGYLHANCSHCHNGSRPEAVGPRCFDPEKSFDLYLTVGRLGSPSETATYETAIGDIVEPGDPEGSELFQKMSHRGEGKQMPPLATDVVDDAGVALMRRWIGGL